jgi:hypothetical protein
MSTSNVSQLDPILQKLISNDITLREEEIREVNRNLQEVSGMKRK